MPQLVVGLLLVVYDFGIRSLKLAFGSLQGSGLRTGSFNLNFRSSQYRFALAAISS